MKNAKEENEDKRNEMEIFEMKKSMMKSSESSRVKKKRRRPAFVHSR